MFSGIVIKTTGSWHTVLTDDGIKIACRVKGKFRIKGLRITNPVAVGDRVSGRLMEKEDIGMINRIEPRQNYIIRKSINLSKEAHIIAANIDLALLVVSMREPTTYSVFIDRFLVSAEAYKIQAGIIFNKTDIYTDDDTVMMHAWKRIYQKAGYTCLETSAKSRAGISELSKLMDQKLSLFSGNSGVGKSSLINSMDASVHLKTGNISE